MVEEVILVNANDEAIGTIEKLEAHKKGLLHRAFSVFIFNSDGLMLLQRRAINKYHSGGLWTNACCSHPRPGESTETAAKRRLKEEMGIETALMPKSVFTYKTKFENDLIEHEIDHVYIGTYNKNPIINPEEVDSYSWLSLADIKASVNSNPEKYTSWFKIALNSF